MLNPSKNKALTLAITWGVVTVALPFLCSSINYAQWPCFAIPALIIAAIYSIVWYSKYSRDQQLGTQATQQRIEPTQEFGARAPQTTPGSERIFLPGPLPPENV